MPHTVEVENENFRQLLGQPSRVFGDLATAISAVAVAVAAVVAAACCKFSAIDATATTATWHYR